MGNFETHPKKLKEELLTLVHTREMALPDFQRDFVWQPAQTKALIVSLAKEFPAGSLLRIENSGAMFAARAVASAPELNGHSPKYLVLDGQQRLTSLYQALYGTGDHLYYVRLSKLMEDPPNPDEAIFYEKRERGEKLYGTRHAQGRLLVLPLQVIFGGDGFHSWLDEIAVALDGEPAAPLMTVSARAPIRTAYDSFVKPIVDYQFPVVTLAANSSLEAVCTIFETLNNTGVRLSVFDLLSARYFAKGVHLRDMWTTAQESSEHLDRFAIDAYYLLQSVCALEKKSVKRSDVLALEAHQVVKHWGNAVWGMEEALGMLYHECGVLKPDLLSYGTILVPLASIFARYRHLKGPEVGAMRSKVKRWYWCSVFGQTYESNPTSQSITDLNELADWISGGMPPESVRNFTFDPATLYATTTRQRAIYRGVLCLVLRRPPLDFHSTKKLTSGLIEEHRVDDHHVFPNGYLSGKPNLAQRDIDCILNRTLIDRQTNQIIGKNPPSKYLNDIHIAQNSAADIDEVLASHYLPTGADSSLRKDLFDQFRKERAAILGQLIAEATGWDGASS